MIGGGSQRGLALSSSLIAEGLAIRIVSRDGVRREAIEAIGAECWPGTPDVVGTIRYALENVTVLCWLLGTATGEAMNSAPVRLTPEDAAREDHRHDRSRVVFESAGTIDADLIASGEHEVRWAFEHSEIPYAGTAPTRLTPGCGSGPLGKRSTRCSERCGPPRNAGGTRSARGPCFM